MISDRKPFASRTIIEHLMRGLGAIVLLAFVAWLLSVPGLWRGLVAIPSVIVALILMRGCPMCWLTGLIGTITNHQRKTTNMSNIGALESYQEPSDLRLVSKLAASAPVEAAAFLAFNASAERSDGIIPAKYRELISIGVALTTQCSYCLDVHTRRALAAGATREEIAETTFVAAALRAGAALGHGLLVQKIVDAVENAK